MRGSRLLACMVVATGAMGIGFAGQPDRPRVPQPRGPQVGEQPEERGLRWLTPERLRARLENRLSQTDRDLEILETRRSVIRRALERLDNGDAAADVAHEWIESDPPQRPENDGVGPGGPPVERGGGNRPNRGGEPGADGGNRGAPREFSPEERERLKAALAREFPQVHARIEALGAAAPGEMERMFMRVIPRVREIQELRERDPEMADIRRRELQAAFDIVATSRALRDLWRAKERDEQAIAARRAELRAAFAEAFDARSDSQALELGRLTDRVKQIEEELAARRANRDAQIDEQLERIEFDSRVANQPPTRGG